MYESTRILVVDDNPAARYAIARSLRDAGMQVMAAANAEQAIPMTANVAAMVIDVHLPGMSGLELCRRVRSAENGTRRPIVLISAHYVGEKDIAAGLAAGADAYLPRPIEGQELASILGTLLFPGSSAQAAG